MNNQQNKTMVCNSNKSIFKKVTLILILVAVTISSCKKENASTGFSDDIKNNIPDSILRIARDLGMPIYEGKTPPIVPSIFLFDTLILEKSNFVDNFSVGTRFANYKYRTSNQNNTNLTITIENKYLNFLNGTVLGQDPPTKAYLSGYGNFISIFTISKSYNNTVPVDSLLGLNIISGEVVSNGLKNPKYLYLVLNDFGDPNDRYISIGQGRLDKEGDNLAETQSVFRLANPTTTNTTKNKSACIYCN